MKGDFSRGFNPDRKRGFDYRRVLLQQGRLLLDSDFNAMVDAHDHLLRLLAGDLGCLAGSPDLGYLITPGRLLALFDHLGDVEVTAGTLDFRRDYMNKYLDRYPSLRLANTSGAPATAGIALRSVPDAPDILVWARSEAAVSVSLDGNAVNVNSSDFAPFSIPAPAGDTLQVTVDSGDVVWIALIEEDQDAGSQPNLWVAPGRFYLDGLIVENPRDQMHPDIHAPLEVPDLLADDGGLRPLEAGDRIVAYLESWERHITAVEDRGVLEEALGGRSDQQQDTTTRSFALGQVKLAYAPPDAANVNLPEAPVIEAVRNPLLLDGTLDVTTAEVPPDPDPCALPVEGGYTGDSNRLYRFEVHAGGDLASTVIKWSRDNGSDLFAVQSTAPAAGNISQLSFPSDTPLRDRDLVEVLNDNVDLGDTVPGLIESVPEVSFTPSERRAGRMVRLLLTEGTAGSGEVTFSMAEPDDDSLAVTLGEFQNPPLSPLKVRRWHGLIDPDGAADPHEEELEDGIEVSLTGNFRVGDWWQYEARTRGPAGNGDFQTSPHGPERLFAPLALLEYQSPDDPLLLISWLDDRFSRLCELCADDICFDGAGIGEEECDTVQEVIEKLWEREEGGCCEFTLEPGEGDDAAAIREILDGNPGDVHICLRPGIYRFASQVLIEDREVVLHGCPEALILVETSPQAPLAVLNNGRLILHSLIVFAQERVEALIDLVEEARSLQVEECGLLIADPQPDQVAIRDRGTPPAPAQWPLPGFGMPPGDPQAGPAVELRDSVFLAGWVLSAVSLNNLEVSRCFGLLSQGGFSAARLERAEIIDNTFRAGFDLSASADWSPEEVEERAPDLVDDLVAAATPITQVGNAVIAAGLLANANVARNRFVSNMGVVVFRAQQTRLRENRYSVLQLGVAFEEAFLSGLDGEQVISTSQSVISVHLASQGSHIEVRSCRLQGVIGILMASYNLQTIAPVDFDHVQLAHNQISAFGMGIHVGGSLLLGTIDDLLIHGNQIQSQTGMQLVGGVEGGEARARVTENTIRARQGIDCSGRRFDLTDNHLIISGTAEFGIRYEGEGRIANNVIDVAEAQSLEDNSAAIQLFFPNFFTLFDNVVRGTGLLSLYAQNGVEPDFKGNRFAGDVTITNMFTVFFRNNTMRALDISDISHGTVSENVIDAFPGPIRITDVRGDWQVNDNRTDGELTVLPRVEGQITGGNFGFANNLAAASGPAANAINVLADVSDDDVEVVGVVAGGARGDSEDGPAFLETAERARRISRALEFTLADNFIEDAGESVAAAVGAAAAAPLAEVAFDDFIVIFLGQEDQYEAQLVGNRCGSMRVGFQGTNITPDDQTQVLVAANHVADSLQVKEYRIAVVSENLADSYSAWIATTARVAGPNVEH